MRNLLLCFLLICCLIEVQGQVVTVVQPVFAQGGNPTFVRLLTATLINHVEPNLQVFLKVVLTQDGGEVLSATTANFRLPPLGESLPIDQYSAGPLLFPLENITADRGVRDFVALTATLPPGRYEFCIEVIRSSDRNSNPIGHNCTTVSYENYTAVNLLTPTNQATVPIALPLLTWSMLSGDGAAFSPNTFYSLRIVQLLQNQSPQAAIQSNPAVFVEDQLSTNMLQYPVTSQPLLPCSTYAWQVVAYQQNLNQRRTLATSEVWAFKMDCGIGLGGPGGGGPGGPGGGGPGGPGGGGPGGPGGGGPGGGGPGICAECDSLTCKNYKVELQRIRKDTTAYYQIWLENTYTGPDADFQPRSIALTVGTDSVMSTPDSLSNQWNLSVGTPTASKSQVWKVKVGRIKKEKSKPGNIQFSGPSTDRITLWVAWKNNKDVVICRDTIDLFETTYYFDLNGPQTEVVQETAEKKLRVQFHNPYAAREHLDVKIYDLATRQLLTPSTNQFSNQGTVQGLNRIAIDLKRYPLTLSKSYLLEITDYMSHYHMKFKPITQNPSNL